MPLSKDETKRARQLANLQPGRGKALPGNRQTVTHGAYAALPAERVDQKIRQVAAALSEDAPVRDPDGGLPAADTVAVRQLAEALCRLDDIGEYLARRGWEDASGKPRPVLEYEGQLRTHVLRLLEALGMTPASRAKLGVDLARTKRSLEDEVRDAAKASASAWDADATGVTDETA